MDELLIDESRLSDSLESFVDQSILNGAAIRVVLTAITAFAEDRLDALLTIILKKNDAEHLYTIASLALKELVTNAARANLKHYMRRHNKAGAPLFLSRELMEQFASDLKKTGLEVHVRIQVGAGYISLAVINTEAPSDEDKIRLKKQLSIARTEPDLRKLHAESKAGTEGGGIGLVMIANALRSAGISSNALTYDLDQDKLTIVEIKFPSLTRAR